MAALSWQLTSNYSIPLWHLQKRDTLTSAATILYQLRARPCCHLPLHQPDYHGPLWLYLIIGCLATFGMVRIYAICPLGFHHWHKRLPRLAADTMLHSLALYHIGIYMLSYSMTCISEMPCTLMHSLLELGTPKAFICSFTSLQIHCLSIFSEA